MAFGVWRIGETADGPAKHANTRKDAKTRATVVCQPLTEFVEAALPGDFGTQFSVFRLFRGLAAPNGSYRPEVLAFFLSLAGLGRPTVRPGIPAASKYRV